MVLLTQPNHSFFFNYLTCLVNILFSQKDLKVPFEYCFIFFSLLSKITMNDLNCSQYTLCFCHPFFNKWETKPSKTKCFSLLECIWEKGFTSYFWNYKLNSCYYYYYNWIRLCLLFFYLLFSPIYHCILSGLFHNHLYRTISTSRTTPHVYVMELPRE